MTLPYRRILVTGASGFIGSRLCEHLVLAHGATVRGTYHRPARAARVARLPLELVRLDLADQAAIEAAVDGCDAVVHCAYGSAGDERTRRELTGLAAGRVAEAARRRGARRFVHLSSVAVWGFGAGPGEIAESAPTLHAGHPYVDGKNDAEEAVAAAAARGLPTAVLRPGNVYGPWSATWTIAPVATLRAGDVAIVGDGAAPANTVYVDNLVSAVVLALSDERAVGRTFVVVDEDGLSWRDLYEAYAEMLSPPAEVRTLPEVDWRRQARASRSWRAALGELRSLVRSPEAAALVRAAAGRPALRRIGSLLPARARRRLEPPPVPVPASTPPPNARFPGSDLMSVQTSGAVFRARGLRELGWSPPVPAARALELTAAWLQYARRL